MVVGPGRGYQMPQLEMITSRIRTLIHCPSKFKAVGNPVGCQGVLSAVTRGGVPVPTAGAPGGIQALFTQKPREHCTPTCKLCNIFFETHLYHFA